MNAVMRIQQLLRELPDPGSVPPKTIYLNVINNEFAAFPGTVTVPRIPAGELGYELGADIVRDLAAHIPDFLAGHTLLEKRKPAADQHSLQFVELFPGRAIDFIHLFKLDLKFGGDSSTVVARGDSDHYPSYVTDRVYFKSRLIPVPRSASQEVPPDFSPLRLIESASVDAEQYFHTYALFDDISMKDLSIGFCGHFPPAIFTVSRSLYQFFVCDFYTCCFNVPLPTNGELNAAVSLFEPAFVYLASRYGKTELLGDTGMLAALFRQELDFSGGEVALRDECVSRLGAYFGRFRLHRDDELALKGWWRFGINDPV